jgi:uncharacterized protein (TIGR00369 family)
MTTEPDEALARSDYNFYRNPLHKMMGLDIVQRGPHAIVKMPLSEDVRGVAVGTIHGGLLATLSDVTCAIALWGTYDNSKEIQVTTDMHVRYYRQPRSWPLTAEARVVHGGRRLKSVECVVTDDDDRQLARATATYMIVPLERPAE